MQITGKYKKRLPMILLMIVIMVLFSMFSIVYKNNINENVNSDNLNAITNSKSANTNKIVDSRIIREYNEEAIKIAYEAIRGEDNNYPLMGCIRIDSGFKEKTAENCYIVFIAGASNNGPLAVTVDLAKKEVVDASPMNYNSLSEKDKIELFGTRDSWTKNWDEYNWSGEPSD